MCELLLVSPAGQRWEDYETESSSTMKASGIDQHVIELDLSKELKKKLLGHGF